jgi:hypothetical protein
VQLFFSRFFFKRARNATDLHKKATSDEFGWILHFKNLFCCRFLPLFCRFASVLPLFCRFASVLVRS